MSFSNPTTNIAVITISAGVAALQNSFFLSFRAQSNCFKH